MKYIYRILGVFLLIILFHSCKKEVDYTIKDIDGNVYTTVSIGTQVWMVENLQTTKFNDGTAIPLVTDNTAWMNLTTPGYCWYYNDVPYGALYNWYAVNTGKLCPIGWHVPSDAEWTTLENYLTNNGYGFEGSGVDIAKSMAATSGWSTYLYPGTPGNDQASNNSSGFTAFPGGYRGIDGRFDDLLFRPCYWWSSTEGSASSDAYCRLMIYDRDVLGVSGDRRKKYGYSVRCIKD